MIRVNQLPRDRNGIICGLWRLTHKRPDFAGQYGVYTFVDGVATIPAMGKALQGVVAVFGHDLFMEPWTEDIPPGFYVPDVFTLDIPTDAIEALEVNPWLDAPDVAPEEGDGVEEESEPDTEPEDEPEPEPDDEDPGDPIEVDLPTMTKAELVSYAADIGLELDERDRKDDLIAAIEEHEAEPE